MVFVINVSSLKIKQLIVKPMNIKAIAVKIEVIISLKGLWVRPLKAILKLYEKGNFDFFRLNFSSFVSVSGLVSFVIFPSEISIILSA